MPILFTRPYDHIVARIPNRQSILGDRRDALATGPLCARRRFGYWGEQIGHLRDRTGHHFGARRQNSSLRPRIGVETAMEKRFGYLNARPTLTWYQRTDLSMSDTNTTTSGVVGIQSCTAQVGLGNSRLRPSRHVRWFRIRPIPQANSI